MTARRFLTLLSTSMIAAFSSTASAAAKDTELLAAIEKLKKAGSYTWHTEVVISPGSDRPVVIDGTYHSTQGLYVKVTSDKYTAELAARSGEVVARTGDSEWKPVKKFTRSDADHTMVRGLGQLKLPHLDLATVQGAWRPGRKNSADFFEGQVSFGAAKKIADALIEQAGGLLRGLGLSRSTGTVTLANGLPEKLVIQMWLSGRGGLLSSGSGVEMTQTTRFSNIGSTTVELPKEAEAQILALKTP